ncbi:MAG TPA: hypothetical protein VFY82_15925 [Acidimicrobiales bacterium]|nr:hypothetical protein [Acidimicrobiales bacterium]
MTTTMTDGDLPPAAQARAREGVEHLQTAARELIEAARAALDVAEEWVNDPESVASLVGTLATVGDVAQRVASGAGWAKAPTASPGSSPGGDVADEPRVQHITVT